MLGYMVGPWMWPSASWAQHTDAATARPHSRYLNRDMVQKRLKHKMWIMVPFLMDKGTECSHGFREN